MADFIRLRRAVSSNDWDTIASLSHLLETRSIKIIDIIDAALDRQDIAMARLVCGRCRDTSCYAVYAVEYAMERQDFKMAVILGKLGYIVRGHDIRLLMWRATDVGHPTNLLLIDWAMEKYKPQFDEEFIDWIEHLEYYKWSLYPRILQHMVYRSFIQRYLDEETIDLMKNVLQKGFDDLPKELIHEICLYLFLCSPPPHNK